jgi:hypothetical protein
MFGKPQRYVLSSQFTIVFTNHFDLTKTTALVPKALTIGSVAPLPLRVIQSRARANPNAG